MKKTDEMLNRFKPFQHEVQTQVGFKVKILRSGNGGKYKSHATKEHCKKNGIRQEFTIPHNPEQNGIAERANRID
jgi:transposase InsO family protein